MGAALSIFVLMSLSIFVVRVGAVALRITGLEDSSARFQALSAFTGTGFTTSETESVVNYPVRRRIVSVLMVIGNLGLVTVLATLVASLVQTQGAMDAVMVQLAWLLLGLALLWLFMLNTTADRIMCGLIGKFLESTTVLGKRSFHRLVQIGDGFSVCEHSAFPDEMLSDGRLAESDLKRLGLQLLAVRTKKGQVSAGYPPNGGLNEGDTVVLFGLDAGHESLGRSVSD